MGAVIKADLTEWLSWPRPQQLVRGHDVLLLRLLGLKQGACDVLQAACAA
jgi:hypothetical protein